MRLNCGTVLLSFKIAFQEADRRGLREVYVNEKILARVQPDALTPIVTKNGRDLFNTAIRVS